MGFRPQHMVFSQKLSDLVAAYEANEETSDWFGEYCDMASTSGYDNDGSIGPDLLDNGIGLALAAREYDSNSIIFFAFGEETAYYQFGKSEDDALARLVAALAQADIGA
jgi:hypothetical protein